MMRGDRTISQPEGDILSRRSFISRGSLLLAGAAAGFTLPRHTLADPAMRPSAVVGLISDVHYAEKDPVGSRHYRDSRAKIQLAVESFNDAEVDFAIHCGDLIDSGGGSVEEELDHLRIIEAEFARCESPRHYVLGNHCLDILSKEEFIEHTAARQPYYSFDHGGWHFIILDACFSEQGEPYQRKNFHWRDTNLPASQLGWLKQDLARTENPTIVFVHQRLDETEHYSVRNAPAVREVLEESRRVVLVVQGHSHRNDHQAIRGIHYVVLRGMVEGPGETNGGHAHLLLFPDGSIEIRGFHRQTNHRLG